MQIGEEKEINITFPENYHPELAGKPVIFKVKINEVKEPQTPAIDDEFAKDVSEFETLEELKKDLGEKLKARREEQAQSDFENAIMAQLIDNMEVEIPNAMIEVQLNRVMDDFNMRLNGQGLKMEDYAAMMGGSVETVREAARPAARRQVEMELAMTAIAKAENFQISDEEVEAELQKMATEFKMEVEKIKDYIGVEDLKKDMCLRKAADLVIAEAKIGEAPKKDEEKPKKTTRKKKVEETVEGEETAEKPKRTRKKKTEDEEPKAE
jgi:trigger factor